MKIQAWLLLILGPLVTVAFIWMPFGFEMSGLIEEWTVLDLFTNQGLFFFATPSSPLPHHSLRPLTIFPHAISYWLDSNSFFFWHIFLILSICLKGISLAYIGTKITRSIHWGTLLGVIGIIHPADTMQLCFRSLHINLALGLLLSSSCLVLLAYEKKQIALKISTSILSAIIFLISVCMYEAGIAMAFLPLFLLYLCRGDLKNISRYLLPQLCWLIVAGIYLAYMVSILSMLKDSYQGDLANQTTFFSVVFKSIPKLFTVTLSRSLMGGWIDAVRISFVEFYLPFYLLTFTAMIGGLSFIKLCKTHECTSNELDSKPPKLILVGIALILFSYLPFAISNSFWNTSQRTYLYATPGASLCTIGFLIWLKKKSDYTGLIALHIVIYSGFAAQLNQFNHYIKISTTQKNLLKTMVENFDGNSDAKSLIIFDESNKLSNLWLLRENLNHALGYFYKKNFPPIQICTLPGMEWQKLNSQFRVGKCNISDETIVFKEAPLFNPDGSIKNISSRDLVIPKNASLVLKIQPDGNISPNPNRDEYFSTLNFSDSDQAKRYRNILKETSNPGKQPRFSIFLPSSPSDRVHWDFGRWWSMDIPIIGSGWNDPIWKFFFHKTVIWKNQEVSRLLFEMNPSNTNYLIRGKINDFLDEEVKASMEIRINKTKVIFTHQKNGFFEGQVLPESLVNGTNTVEFYSKMGIKDPNLSFSLDWLEIIPR